MLASRGPSPFEARPLRGLAPQGDGTESDFSGRWRRIKAYFTHRLVAAGVPVKRHRNGEYALWQRRFWEHTIRNETDFERHVDYVHFNPVKHKLVNRVREWPYSSFHAYVRRGVLPADWAGDVDEPTMDFGERRGEPGFRGACHRADHFGPDPLAPSGLLATFHEQPVSDIL